MIDEPFFSYHWWESFAVVWNQHDERPCLAGLGALSIVVSDEFLSVLLTWDAEGRLEVSPVLSHCNTRLIAPLANWQALVGGQFSPIDAVLSGKIVIEGEASLAIRFNEGIERMCLVMRRFSEASSGLP